MSTLWTIGGTHDFYFDCPNFGRTQSRLLLVTICDDYLYASFRQAAWTLKARENRMKNVGLLAEFETFLEAE
ncbi:hypothetical protein [Bacillus sp. NSP9.1]|uniref:hypothetical protein n=1 Tax=Bacillus sp. NSP9.1 TaxID=1071078 RepID=UPI001F2ADD41|nr:hypothetical protein [Bacillus sp. NSP9.1]